MDLKNKLFIVLCTLIANIGIAKVYPELLAKQANDNIRFISIDGKSTYYQKRSGSLHFSKNYKIFDVLKGGIGTQYTLFASAARKKIIISQNEIFHTFLSLRYMEKIFIVGFGEVIAREVGNGISPKLHLNDNWISYYDPYLKVINFEHTTNIALKFSIKLNNKINPYFIPNVVMIDENNILYTDLAENGSFGLVQHVRSTNQTSILNKALNVTTKINIERCGENVIYSEVGYPMSANGTKIYIIPAANFEFKTKEKVYSSELNDLGNTTCDFNNTHFYFSKNTGTSKSTTFDIAEFDMFKKSFIVISDLKTAASIVNMDGILLTFDKGKYLIIKGETDYKTVDNLKLPPAKTTPKVEDN